MPIYQLVHQDTLDKRTEPVDGNPTYRPLTDSERRQFDHDNYLIETTYEGRVIARREMNGYDDSDFYAWVQTDDGHFKEVMYATTRGWTYLNGATVDATPDVVDAYQAWRKDTADRLRAEAAEYEAGVAKIGDHVLIDGGRKYKGITGTLAWIGEDRYKTNRNYFPPIVFHRVGIDPDGGGKRVFVPYEYLRVERDGELVEPNRPYNVVADHSWLFATPEPQAPGSDKVAV